MSTEYIAENENETPVTQQEEYDLGGPSVEAGRFNFTITEGASRELKNGTQHVFTFESEAVPFPIEMGFWYTYPSKPEVERIGRGNIRRVVAAALGVTVGQVRDQKLYRGPNSLIDRVVSAETLEDDNGFARLKNFQAAKGSNGEA